METNSHAYTVAGMTCGHCVSAVTAELSALPGVVDVAVELIPGEDSMVTVSSQVPLTEPAVAQAIEEAGYELVTDEVRARRE